MADLSRSLCPCHRLGLNKDFLPCLVLLRNVPEASGRKESYVWTKACVFYQLYEQIRTKIVYYLLILL